MLCARIVCVRVGQHKARGEESLAIILRNRPEQSAVVLPDRVAWQPRIPLVSLHRCTRCLDRDLTVAPHHHGQLLREEEVPVKEVIERIVVYRVIEDIVPICVDRALNAQQVEQGRIDVHMLHHTIGDLAAE